MANGPTLKSLRTTLQKKSNTKNVLILQRFFKTEKGQYGEGDRFIGIKMPDIRLLSREFGELDSISVKKLALSSIHEERMLGFLILVRHYQQAIKKKDSAARKRAFRVYWSSRKGLNNWDLIDVTVPSVVGQELKDGLLKKRFAQDLAASSSLWERRIAMLCTFPLIRDHQFEVPLEVAELLLHDEHDLIHKAVGWLLREIGKRDPKVLVQFLVPRQKIMPRTMLRYAIEKFPERARKKFLLGEAV